MPAGSTQIILWEVKAAQAVNKSSKAKQLKSSVRALGPPQLGVLATRNPAPTRQDRGSEWAGSGFLENSLGRTVITIETNSQDLRA